MNLEDRFNNIPNLKETSGSLNRYKIINSFEDTYIAEEMKKEELMRSSIFRIFEAAKPHKYRKLNIDPTQVFDPFHDSLMDYASIIGFKLQKPWNQFNRLISIHIPFCFNDCWHCYLPKVLYTEASNIDNRYIFLSAQDIIDKFEDQRQEDLKKGKFSNVLRITGGEPFLLPELILECLQQLQKKGLDEKVFLWTETNLEPFIGNPGKAFVDKSENRAILEMISKFKNFAVHPCFHGLSSEETNDITGKMFSIHLADQISGLKRLLDFGIDIYPTIGSNVCNPNNLPAFFELIRALHHDLPLRFALVEYNLAYPPIGQRIEDNKIAPPLYSKFATLRIWNRLLLDNNGIGYGILPRHLVSLESISRLNVLSSQISSPTAGEEILFFFKSSDRDLYHREVLDYLALPANNIVEMTYEKRHVQDDLFSHISFLPDKYKGRKAIWSYADNFNHSLLPFRMAEIYHIRTGPDFLNIKLKLDKFIIFPDSNENLEKETTNVLIKYFGSKNLPPDGKYLLIGENSILEDICTSKNNRKSVGAKFKISEGESALRCIVPHLIDNKPMKESIFYQIEPCNLKIRENDQHFQYKIKSNDTFKIKINYYLPNYSEFDEGKPEERTIVVESSSLNIKIIGSAEVVCSKYGNETIYFRAENVSREEEVILTFRGKLNQFKAAKVVLHILVVPNALRKALFSSVGATLLFLLVVNWFIGIRENVNPLDGILDLFSNAPNSLYLMGIPFVILFIINFFRYRGYDIPKLW